MLLKHWTDIGDKVVKMAEEFPEDKYEYRPIAGVRTFADNLRHVAFWNTFVSKTVKGEKVDPKINELPKAEYSTKAAIVKALKSSLDEATDLLKKSPRRRPPRSRTSGSRSSSTRGSTTASWSCISG